MTWTPAFEGPRLYLDPGLPRTDMLVRESAFREPPPPVEHAQIGIHRETYCRVWRSGEYEIRFCLGAYLLLHRGKLVGKPLGYGSLEAAKRAARRPKGAPDAPKD